MDKPQQLVSLAPYTTFNIGGPADYFYQATEVDATAEMIRWAQERELPILILGGGSNVLLPDEGYSGLVIHPQFMKLLAKDILVTAGSGLTLADLLEQTLAAGLVGLEFTAGIPGTVGGAVVGNAGTY